VSCLVSNCTRKAAKKIAPDALLQTMASHGVSEDRAMTNRPKVLLSGIIPTAPMLPIRSRCQSETALTLEKSEVTCSV
jgi:hypothetical protein